MRFEPVSSLTSHAEANLASGFECTDGNGAGDVQASRRGKDRDTQSTIGSLLQEAAGQAATLGTKDETIPLAIACFAIHVRTLSGKEPEPIKAENLGDLVKVIDSPPSEMLLVVQSRTTSTTIIERKTEWAD